MDGILLTVLSACLPAMVQAAREAMGEAGLEEVAEQAEELWSWQVGLFWGQQ